MFLGIFRIVAVAFLTFLFLVILFLSPRCLAVHVVSIYCRLFLWVVGIKVYMPCSVTGCNHLIISNHLSYLDVIVIAAHFPTLFVTSIDLPASSLLLRLVARAAGCIFVDRVKATTLLRDIKEISILLASGYNVTFFPEATTSATGRVLPFKSALFTCSAHSGVDVLALALRYPNLENKDEVYFHSGAQLVPHLSKLLWQGRNIEVEVLVCGFYRMVGDRKQFAREMRDVIGGCV